MATIERLFIRNFASCKDLEIELAKYTPIVGPNNCGKSTVLDAIGWLLEPYALTESLFFDASKEVSVEAWFEGFSSGALAGLSQPNQKKLEPFLSASGSIRVRRSGAGPALSVKNAKVQVFAWSETEPCGGEWQENPAGIWSAIKSVFPGVVRIRAMEDAAGEAAKSKTTNVLGRLLKDVLSSIKALEADFEQRMSSLRSMFDIDSEDRLSDFADFDSRIEDMIGESFPGLGVRLGFSLPSADDLSKFASISVIDSGAVRGFDQLGHGVQRAIHMALVRLLAERVAGTKASAHGVLLIDEPELYLHPAGVEQLRDSLRLVSASAYQVVVATHSPLMFGVKDAENVVVLSRDPISGTGARPTMRRAIGAVVQGHASQAGLLFSLNHASYIFFAKTVVLVEGSTERRVLPTVFEVVGGRSLLGSGIALVALDGGGGAQKAQEVLIHMGLRVKVVVDLDVVLDSIAPPGWVDPNDARLGRIRSSLSAAAAVVGGTIGPNGLPSKGERGSPSKEDVWSRFFSAGGVADDIESLHNDLLANHDVWIWPGGAIESALGVTGKNEGVWSSFNARLVSQGESALADPVMIRRFVAWVLGCELG